MESRVDGARAEQRTGHVHHCTMEIQLHIQPGGDISSTQAAIMLRPVGRRQSCLHRAGGDTVVFPAVRLTSLILYAEH